MRSITQYYIMRRGSTNRLCYNIPFIKVVCQLIMHFACCRYLLTSQGRVRSINDIMPMIGARFYTQLDAAQLRNDVLENELSKEVENGR